MPAMTDRRLKRIFTYDDALSTFPFVRDLTAAAVRQIDMLVHQFASQHPAGGDRSAVEEACQKILDVWKAEVRGLGCEVKGMWLVDWDSGDGYYCWKFPEESIGFFHTYEDGFAGRLPIN
jgi:hypothetical protein